MIPCPACSQPVPEGSRFCPSCATPTSGASVSPTQTSAPSHSQPVSHPSLDEARFLPGAMLAGRYRVIGLLGRGGMGEVYRADDLKLGQPVALKFLPRALERDQGRLTRFLNEVKLARQVSHPSVCRVYDVGESQGQHFLSMEYVDGEDLKSLLRRIGRFPRDKAVQMARQLCAGLAAAHEQGILHRDLKPANVLIDGRGRPKITDFGLAGMTETFVGDEVRAGTPAYQAPEQRAGESVSVRSDVYSLGLVLYELFTGEPAFAGDSIAEIARRQQETTPTAPSSRVEGFDPAVERVLLRCLDKDPTSRPGSALAVAAALPGGDPLAAALAAGETPSPELVAAAGESIEVPRWLPWTCLAVLVVGLPLAVVLAGKVMLYEQVGLDRAPAALQASAQQILRDLGYDDPPVHTVQGFAYDQAYIGHLQQSAGPEEWEAALAGERAPVRYWYRQSPEPLVGRDLLAFQPDPTYPPWDEPGMLGIALDVRGHLVGMHRVPTSEDAFEAEAASTDWPALFALAALDPDLFTEAEPEEVPHAYADEVVAWEGSDPSYPDAKLRVWGAGLRGKPMRFRVAASWEADAPASGTVQNVLGAAANLAVLVLLIAAAFMARWNVRQGRGDRRGARRLALALLVWWVVWFLLATYYDSAGVVVGKFFIRIGLGLLVAGMIWLIYLGIEPFVRRRWPDLLVTWARLLDGKWRDPLVGRDLVMGAACAVALTGLDHLQYLAPSWTGLPVQYQLPGLDSLLGGRLAVAGLLEFLGSFIVLMLSLLALVVLRVLLRRNWAAFAGAVLFTSLFFAANNPHGGIGLVFLVAFSLALVIVMMRFGLLAAAAALYLHAPLAHGAMTSRLGAWHSDFTIAALLLISAVALYGFVISFGGRSLIGEQAFDNA